MADVKVKLNLKQINALMRSEKVQDIVNDEAQRIADRAGPDFEVAPSSHRYTARAFVQAANFKGMEAEARDKVLTRAVHG